MNTSRIIMGSTCSMQRHHDEYNRNYSNKKCSAYGRSRVGNNRNLSHEMGSNASARNSLRHSVVCAIPDGCIESLYPVEDNYINVIDGENGGMKRSPKKLSDLCVDTICRTLPYMNGELPHGLPNDVVDDIVTSLIQHSALTATTLRLLKNCELNALSLAGCRGVTDAWFEPLCTNHGYSSCSNTSSPENSPISAMASQWDDIEPMILEETTTMVTSNDPEMVLRPPSPPNDVFYNAFESRNVKVHHDLPGSASKVNDDAIDEDERLSNCSCSSFVSATANGTSPLLNINETDHHDGRQLNVSSSPLSSVTMHMTLLDIRGSYSLTDRGLMQLMNLQSLEVAKLDNCHSITGRGLLVLCHSRSLHTLSLSNCRRLTDEAVINISHLLSLQSLSLGGCRCITDRSMAAIADLYNVRQLDLSQCDLITDRGLQQLEHLASLQEISLGWCRQITDVGIDMFTLHHGRDTNLRVLRLARCPITDEGVNHLGRLLALEELDLNGCSSIGSAVLGSALEKMKHLTVLDVSYCPSIIRSSWQGKIRALKSLDLCYSSVKDAHIVKFMNLASLEELNLDSCLVGDNAISHLADNNVVPNLTSLDLADTNVTDVGMVKIAKFKKLTRLSLFYCNITNNGLRHISKLTELEVLNLDSRDISDDGLTRLYRLTKLKSLDVFSGRITDAGCVHIAKIESLESLELCGGGIGDLGCSLLANLDNLTSLNLSQNDRITNRGAAALATLTNLKALNLSNTQVNSLALRFFSGLLKLQSLALYGCRDIDDENMLGKLRSGLPNLRCLRLNTSSDEDGMVMTTGNESEDDDDDDDEIDDDDDPNAADAAIWNHFHKDDAMDDDATLYSDHD